MDFQSSRIRTTVHVHGMYLSDEWNWPLQKQLALAYVDKVVESSIYVIILNISEFVFSMVQEDANVIFVQYDAKICRLQNFYLQLVANIRVVGAIVAR